MGLGTGYWEWEVGIEEGGRELGIGIEDEGWGGVGVGIEGWGLWEGGFKLCVDEWRLKMRGWGLELIYHILRAGDWELRSGYQEK